MRKRRQKLSRIFYFSLFLRYLAFSRPPPRKRTNQAKLPRFLARRVAPQTLRGAHASLSFPCKMNLARLQYCTSRQVVYSHHLQGFLHPRWLFRISSINSITEILRAFFGHTKTPRHGQVTVFYTLQSVLIHHLAWLKFRYDLFDVQSFDVLFAPKTNISLGLKDDSFPFEMVPFQVTFVHFRGYVKMVEINIRYLGFIPRQPGCQSLPGMAPDTWTPQISREKRGLFF